MNILLLPSDIWIIIGHYLKRNEKYNIAISLFPMISIFPFNKWKFNETMYKKIRHTIAECSDRILYSTTTNSPSFVFADWSPFLSKNRICKPIATIWWSSRFPHARCTVHSFLDMYLDKMFKMERPALRLSVHSTCIVEQFRDNQQYQKLYVANVRTSKHHKEVCIFGVLPIMVKCVYAKHDPINHSPALLCLYE